MAPTNNKTVHQTSFTPYREQPRSTRFVVAYPRPAFSATNWTNTFEPVLINNIPSSQGHTSYIKCQSRLWSQRGTKVKGSHHGDNPLLGPTGIQVATKSYATLQAMTPTTVKTVHQTSLLDIESNLDRLGLLSPTHDQRSQQQSGQITLQPVLINNSRHFFPLTGGCPEGLNRRVLIFL